MKRVLLLLLVACLALTACGGSDPKKDAKAAFIKAMDCGSYSVSKARNDVTGNWRVGVLASKEQVADHAAEYYAAYFKDDKEIHCVVNFTFNTTTKIAVAGDSLAVTVYDYVKGEEHDAKLMFSGTQLSQRTVAK